MHALSLVIQFRLYLITPDDRWIDLTSFCNAIYVHMYILLCIQCLVKLSMDSPSAYDCLAWLLVSSV